MGNDLASEVRHEEESAKVRRISSSAATRCVGLGVCEMGPTDGTLRGPFTAKDEWEAVFGGVTATTLESNAAVEGFFRGGGQQLFWGRIVHTTVQGDPTTKTSTPGSTNIMTPSAAPSAGTVISAAQPFNLESADDLDIAIDGGGPVTATFTGAAAVRDSAVQATFALANGQTLVFTDLSGSGVRTKTFLTGEFVSIGAATLAEVAASLNAFFASQGMGAVATVTGGAVRITTTRRGTGANIHISNTSTATALAYATTNIAGTGNVSNIDIVTAAEAQTIIAAAVGVAANVTIEGGAVRITSATTGPSSSVQVNASSTADDEFSYDNAVHSGSAGTAVDTVGITAKWDGTYAAGVRVIVANATDGDSEHFNLLVEKDGRVLETFPNLSMVDADERYIEAVVNDQLAGSLYIQVTDLDAATSLQRPANGPSAFLVGGGNGLGSLADTDYIGGATVNGKTGLRSIDTLDADILIVPGRATQAMHLAMVSYCEITRRGLLFPILDCPANQNAASMASYMDTAGLYGLSEFGAIYWPRVKVTNPSKTIFGNDELVVVPPSGHLAGFYSRMDASKIAGQFEQPAGVDFTLPGVIALETDEVLDIEKRKLVFPKNVNPISQEPGTAIFVDGARCLDTSGNWGSIGQRRGVIFVEKQLIPGLAFMRHKNIRPSLYKEGERTIDLFLTDITRAGALASTNPEEAFFIDLGPGLNTAVARKNKRVYARIGLATSDPAEFIILLVGPDTRALDEELALLAA